MVWFFLAISSALTNSVFNAFSNFIVSRQRFSKFKIVFWQSIIASAILFLVNFLRGFPDVDPRFWATVFVTAMINAGTGVLLLKAYELGEFSSVYSMTLLTPVFLLITSIFFVGEIPSLLGIFGVLMAVFGLYMISRNSNANERVQFKNFGRGNLIGISVAFLWSITTNFDKLATKYSSAFFAPAVALAIIAGVHGIYICFKNKEQAGDQRFLLPKSADSLFLIALGTFFAASNVVHNAALLHGFVSYTIAIKRIGILFGVVWGWLFFRENNFQRKFFGSAVAVLGVILILFA